MLLSCQEAPYCVKSKTSAFDTDPTPPHVAGAGELPLRIAPEKMLVFFESLPYTGLEIGLKNFFHLWPCKIWPLQKLRICPISIH